MLFLTNNRNALELFEWIQGTEKVFLYSENLSIEMIENMSPKIIVSYNYRYIITKEIIDYMKGNIVNLHNSYLPWNRGSNPNFWSFIENTPKGVSVHLIDKGLDTGGIIVQKEISFDEKKETFASTYETLNKEIICLFKESWNSIVNRHYVLSEQEKGGSYHKAKDISDFFNKKDIDWNMKISDFKKLYCGRKNVKI